MDNEPDFQECLSIWNSWPKREVFGNPHYIKLYQNESTKAFCAVLGSRDSFIYFPFLLRDICREEFWEKGEEPTYDLISPYGYGGPYAWGNHARMASTQTFWKLWDNWASEHRIVCEFIRFSLFESELLPYPGRTEERNMNVVRSLDLPLDEIWMDFDHKVRKNVKRARNSGVTVKRDDGGIHLDDFLRVYEATLKRRGARETYFFPRGYFEEVSRSLSGSFMYFHSILDNIIVSTELVLVSEESIYSFLGGTDETAYWARPNDILKYEILTWGKTNGKKMFVLGGGYGRGDGIFQYKLSFAPHGIIPFKVGWKIHLPSEYNRLLMARKRHEAEKGRPWEPKESFFPAYRS